MRQLRRMPTRTLDNCPPDKLNLTDEKRGTTSVSRRRWLVILLLVVNYLPAHDAAHPTTAGRGVFPVTLPLDDPGVADEVTLPQIVVQPGSGPSNDTALLWEWDKTITPTTALIYNHGYDFLDMVGTKHAGGFENIVLTGKWQAWVVPEREFILSLGVQRELPGNSRSSALGIGDAQGSTAPVVYFGKGLGDLPIGPLRPLAVTGELSYTIPDRRLNTDGDNGGTVPSWTGGLSVQYSLPYLQSQVQDFGLPEFFNRLVPLMKMNWSSPAGRPNGGQPMTP